MRVEVEVGRKKSGPCQLELCEIEGAERRSWQSLSLSISIHSLPSCLRKWEKEVEDSIENHDELIIIVVVVANAAASIQPPLSLKWLL